jgi:uncharacterized membrane protein YgcG
MNAIRGSALIVCAGLVLVAQALADERILDFHSDVRVNADTSMEVSETIRVLADGTRIKHGIVRTFPTDYRDTYGNAVHVGFQVIAAEREHAPEPWRSEPFENGVRVYLGDANTTVDGEQEYTLRYRTTRQLGFFADHDELYWNVTGDGWAFAIDHASASVTLPGAVAPADIKLAAYTGAQGAKGRNYQASADAPSSAQFETTTALGIRQGLTIVVGFPKGVVTPPGAMQKAQWLFSENPAVAAGCLGLLIVLAYFFITWWRVGRDPRSGPIMPQYEAPAGLTPATLRFVEQEGYDDRCFAADLVDLGVRGALQIQQSGKDYVLKNLATPAADVPELEKNLHNDLLNGRTELALEQSQQPIIAKARSAHGTQINTTCRAPNFHKNTGKLWIGVLLSLLTMLAVDLIAGMHLENNGRPVPLFVMLLFSLFLFIFGAIGASLLQKICDAWANAAKGRSGYGKAVLTTILSGFGALISLAVFSLIGWPASYFGAGLAVALLLIITLFSNLLPAPTAAGRKLLDQIQGLRLYLSVAERDTLARMQTPAMTEREFQRFLPYALALNVEKNWTDRFAAAVGPAAFAASAAAMTWYYSDNAGFSSGNFGDFTTNLGDSLSDSISTSATAPGSSSGFSSDSGGSSSDSGGSSGGGGGGGGGDGW